MEHCTLQLQIETSLRFLISMGSINLSPNFAKMVSFERGPQYNEKKWAATFCLQSFRRDEPSNGKIVNVKTKSQTYSGY